MLRRSALSVGFRRYQSATARSPTADTAWLPARSTPQRAWRKSVMGPLLCPERPAGLRSTDTPWITFTLSAAALWSRPAPLEGDSTPRVVTCYKPSSLSIALSDSARCDLRYRGLPLSNVAQKNFSARLPTYGSNTRQASFSHGSRGLGCSLPVMPLSTSMAWDRVRDSCGDIPERKQNGRNGSRALSVWVASQLSTPDWQVESASRVRQFKGCRRFGGKHG